MGEVAACVRMGCPRDVVAHLSPTSVLQGHMADDLRAGHIGINYDKLTVTAFWAIWNELPFATDMGAPVKFPNQARVFR